MKPAIAIGIGAGVLAVGGVLVWKFWDKLSNINKGTPYEGAGVVGTAGNAVNQALGGVPQSVGEAIGSGLFTLVNGDYESGDVEFYTTNFPDGSRHAIKVDSVDSDGSFRYLGVGYTMTTDRNGQHFAFAS